MSDKLYAKIARVEEKFEELDGEYTKLLNVFAGVITGVTDPRRIIINLTNQSYATSPLGEGFPSMPGTMDLGDGRGPLPLCVVGCDGPRISALSAIIQIGNAELEKARAEVERLKGLLSPGVGDAGQPCAGACAGACPAPCVCDPATGVEGDRMPGTGPVKMGL